MTARRRKASTPPGVRVLSVDRRESGLRLDLFLVGALPELSRKRSKRLIDQRKVSVNGRIEAMASRSLQGGERVEVRIETEPPRAAPPPLEVLYEDDQLLAVNKPWGFPSGPTRDPSRLHVELLARRRFGEGLTLVHRLDKDTSGVLLLAKTSGSARDMARRFKQRAVEKVYLALVCGSLPPEREVISHLREGEAGRMHTVRSGGARAVTRVRRLAAAGGVALIEARPLTGRTHQIRVHLSQLGCPILGDSLYGGLARLGTTPVNRHQLHALSLAFTHPLREAEVTIQAPPPDDFLHIARDVFGPRLPSVLSRDEAARRRG